MLAAARQLLSAGLHRGLVLRVALLLVADAAQPTVGVRVRNVGQAVVPHALRELTHLLHKGWVAQLLVFAAWGERGLLRVCGGRRLIPGRRAAGCQQCEDAEQRRGSGRAHESPPARSWVTGHRSIAPSQAVVFSTLPPLPGRKLEASLDGTMSGEPARGLAGEGRAVAQRRRGRAADGTTVASRASFESAAGAGGRTMRKTEPPPG